MLKVLLITTILATGMTTTTTFDSMERCLEHREQILEQSTGVSATCVCEDKAVFKMVAGEGFEPPTFGL